MADRLVRMTNDELGRALAGLAAELSFPEPSTDLAALAVARIRRGELVSAYRAVLFDFFGTLTHAVSRGPAHAHIARTLHRTSFERPGSAGRGVNGLRHGLPSGLTLIRIARLPSRSWRGLSGQTWRTLWM